MKNSKTWSLLCLSITLVLLILCAVPTAVIDPFFHYHGPLPSLQYPLNNQRYQNDGIVKHFDYDALITGTSLTENFKTSEMDALFGTNSVKVCFSGGTYEEIISNLERALEANSNIRYVIFGIDEWHLVAERTLIEASGDFPTYLYDKNPLNDVHYLLNKDVLCSNTIDVLRYSQRGEKTTSFDTYSSWHLPVSPEELIEGYDRPDQISQLQALTDSEISVLSENLRTGILKLALAYPQTQFYCFFPPYSILNWDMHLREGVLENQIQQFVLATEILLEAENIHLYSFYTDYETVTNLENYKDIVHYNRHINTVLLERMCRGEYLLTKETYRSHWQEVLDYYRNYDYDMYFSAT